jgi:hypothetical protein
MTRNWVKNHPKERSARRFSEGKGFEFKKGTSAHSGNRAFFIDIHLDRSETLI